MKNAAGMQNDKKERGYMKRGLIGVQMSTIAPAKMPNFDVMEAMKRLADIGYHCVEISQVP